MSVSYYAYTIIGVKLPRGALYRQEQERGCMHTFDLSFAYCPTCGRETYHPRIRPIFNEMDSSLGACQVILISETEDAYIAGWYAKASDWNCSSRFSVIPTPLDLDAVRVNVQLALEGLGLWDESKYGLWTVLEAS